MSTFISKLIFSKLLLPSEYWIKSKKFVAFILLLSARDKVDKVFFLLKNGLHNIFAFLGKFFFVNNFYGFLNNIISTN